MLGLLSTFQTNPYLNICLSTARLEQLVVQSSWRQQWRWRNETCDWTNKVFILLAETDKFNAPLSVLDLTQLHYHTYMCKTNVPVNNKKITPERTTPMKLPGNYRIILLKLDLAKFHNLSSRSKRQMSHTTPNIKVTKETYFITMAASNVFSENYLWKMDVKSPALITAPCGDIFPWF